MVGSSGNSTFHLWAFSKAAALFYVPSSHVHGFPFLHILPTLVIPASRVFQEGYWVAVEKAAQGESVRRTGPRPA